MRIAKDMDQFLAMDGDLYIYGAGSCGYWIGHYKEKDAHRYSGYSRKRLG